MVLPERYRDVPAFSFGDSPHMADSGLADVIARRQTATCGSLEILRRPDRFEPFEGALEIVFDGRGEPGCVIRTFKVAIRQFDEIDEEFAREEACIDLAQRREIHEAYFRRLAVFSPDMKLVCQYFDVVDIFGKHRGKADKP